MANERWPVRWNNATVGWIDSPDYDFPHCYGQWIPAGSNETSDFLAALRKVIDEDGEGLEVVVNDNMPGVVYDHPDDNDGDLNVRTQV